MIPQSQSAHIGQDEGIGVAGRLDRDTVTTQCPGTVECSFQFARDGIVFQFSPGAWDEIHLDPFSGTIPAGCRGLSAEFDAVYGRVTLWPDGWRMPYLSDRWAGPARHGGTPLFLARWMVIHSWSEKF